MNEFEYQQILSTEPFIKVIPDSMTPINGFVQLTCPLLPEVKPAFVHYSKSHNDGQFRKRILKAILKRFNEGIDIPQCLYPLLKGVTK